MPEKDADEASVFIVEEEDENAANEAAEAEQRKNANRAAPKVKLKLVR